MEIRFIDDGTKMDIQVFSKKNLHLDEKAFLATFLNSDRGNNFSIECDELYVHANSFAAGCYFEISFFKGAEVNSFRARINGSSLVFGRNAILMTAISPIEKSNRRKTPRIEASFPVNIYHSIGSMSGELISKETTYDVSNGGINVVTNVKLPIVPNNNYHVEFSIGPGRTFSLVARLLRSGNSPKNLNYRFDHAFIFDYPDGDEKISKLALALFDYRFRNI